MIKRLRSLLVRILVAMAGAALVVGGIIAVGSALRNDGRLRERHQFSIDEIECDSPPGQPRAEFLAEVHYYGQMPEMMNALDLDLPEKLKSAFAKHPRVERVERVTIASPKRVRVQLIFGK